MPDDLGSFTTLTVTPDDFHYDDKDRAIDKASPRHRLDIYPRCLRSGREGQAGKGNTLRQRAWVDRAGFPTA
jgi:hypothetical protein